MEPTPFNGSGDASAWLTAFDERSKKKSPSWKMKRFEKLVKGEARDWWYMLRDADHWDILREMFVAYWVDGLRGERYQIKCKEVVSKASSTVLGGVLILITIDYVVRARKTFTGPQLVLQGVSVPE